MMKIKDTMFQYISCCYLSNTYRKAILVSVEFQYISCCYLSLFTSWQSIPAFSLFQYISCCYLSRLPPIGMFSLNCFNTSHVVIYPSLEKKQVESEKFQYISCCYLSGIPAESMRRWSQFQYISCCYLSSQEPLLKDSDMSFNTSHVVIYLLPSHPCSHKQ